MCHGQMIGDAILKARKPHRCEVCDGYIKPGAVYYRQTVSDGGLSTWKAHERCVAMLWASEGDYDGCYIDPRTTVTESAHANWRWLRAEARRNLTALRARFNRPTALAAKEKEA